jgi:hypothetical protein
MMVVTATNRSVTAEGNAKAIAEGNVVEGNVTAEGIRTEGRNVTAGTWWSRQKGRERDDRRECYSITAEGNIKARIAEGNVMEGDGGECHGSRRREEGKGTGNLERREPAAEVNNMVEGTSSQGRRKKGTSRRWGRECAVIPIHHCFSQRTIVTLSKP